MKAHKRREPEWPPLEEDVRSPEDVRRAFHKGLLVGCLTMGCVAAVAVAALVLLGIMVESGALPDSAAVPGHELREETLGMLRESGVLGEDEEVLYYYSDAMLSFREDGNFFTDQRVVSYWIEDGDLIIEEATYPEITDITTVFNDGFFENTDVWVERLDGDSFYLAVGNESGRDHVFVELLMDTWRSNR